MRDAQAAPSPEAELTEMRQRVIAIMRANVRLHRQLFRNRMRDVPVGVGEARALLRLGAQQGLTQVQLAERLDIQPITLTHQLDRLEEAGYVLRSASSEDRRVRLLHLTAEGKALAKRLLKIVHELDEEITAELSTETLSRLAASLESMHVVLTRMR